MKKLEKGLKELKTKFNEKEIEEIIKLIKLTIISNCIPAILLCYKLSRYSSYE